MSAPPDFEQVTVSLAGAAATVTLNRPEQRNPLSAGMLRDLIGAFQWVRGEAEVRVAVLTGAGDRAFCAGADLAGFASDAPILEQHQGRKQFVDLFDLLQDLGKPLIGRINGHALAGGFGLACSCDILIAAETATFGTPEILVGVWPMMIQAILMRNLPRKRVLEMMLLGERWTAGQMHEAGLVSRVVPASGLDSAVAEVAARLATRSPAIMKLGRDSFYRQQDMEFRAALDYLQSQLTLAVLSEDAREGVTAFFEKRDPVFKGL